MNYYYFWSPQELMLSSSVSDIRAMILTVVCASVAIAAPLEVAVNLADTRHQRPLAFEFGVDHGPLCDGTNIDLSAALLSMGASLIRTHDSGVLDWPVIFPHPALNVSTSDPASYDFAAADEYFARIVNAGLEPYFRLGTSWAQLGGGLPPAGTWYNMTALVDVMVHTVMHFNDGWANGFSGKSVRYFEVWNEPDSVSMGSPLGRFWNRTAEDFYDLVDAIVRAVKTYDPNLKVGTDGIADATTPSSAPYSWGLIAELARRRTPFDFFSWHCYSAYLPDFVERAALVRANLDAAGLTHVAQHTTEWFPCILCPEQDTAQGAAAVAGTLATLLQANVSLATLYPLCSAGDAATGPHGWGLFDDESVPGQATWRKLTFAFADFGDMMQTTTTLLPATVNTTDTSTTALATASSDFSVVKVQVASQSAPEAGLLLSLNGLGSSSGTSCPWRYEITLTTANITNVRVAAGVLSPSATNNGSIVVSVPPFVAPAVAMFSFWRIN